MQADAEETIKWKNPVSVHEGMEMWKRKHEDKYRHRYQTRDGCYWPFGRPGGGAPNSGNFRKQRVSKKHKEPEATCKSEGKLPYLPEKQVRFSRGAEQILRYQYQKDVRRSIDTHWRYMTTPQEKAAYRMHLDRILHEKRAFREQEMRRNMNQDVQNASMEPPWGKVGPGGQQWRHPRQVGHNFLHSLGWTGEKAFRKLEDQMDHLAVPEHPMISQKAQNDHLHFKTPEEEWTGGIELVPLLARRRSFKKASNHLPTCDVTNRAYFEQPPSWRETKQPQDYHRELNNQVTTKKHQLQAEKEEDRRESRKHFETWGRFWGRPGHGAPRQTKVGGTRSQ
ncbi:uncharacterized protein LOC106669956 isoform X2 [Cimex lectularius]|uniref:Uncharacterized protein n=1 Tax=Cimex lectularius TaxID=79782 RepID=A0A8I6SHZ1_CIMLE|nr:uncharacterized protein LOC106669956 isoform X2 [Cimex lectularius]